MNRYTHALILLCEAILTCLVALLCYLLFDNSHIPFIIAANIGGLAFLFTLLKFGREREMNIFLQDIASILDAIAQDTDYLLVKKDNSMDGFYKNIEGFRDKLKRKEENRKQIFSLVDSIAVNIEIEKLLEDLMPKLMEVSGSNCIAFYIANNITNRLEIKASQGFSKNLYSEFDLTIGEGMIGSAVKNKDTTVVINVPSDTVYSIRTVLGTLKPRNMMIVPVHNRDQLLGVLVLATVNDYTQAQIELVNLMKYYIGVAISNGLAYEKTMRLSNELKFQNKLIQSLNDELERSVRERTGLMNEVLDSIRSEAIYALDINNKIQAWNKRSEEVLGYSAADVMGKHIDCIFPDEVIKDGRIKELFEKAAIDGMHTVNYWRRESDGQRVYLEMSVFARYSESGAPAGFTAVTTVSDTPVKPSIE